jgi:hypothetical protein
VNNPLAARWILPAKPDWQEDLLPQIANGVRAAGIVALSGKLTGRSATSLERYRQAFAGWEEITFLHRPPSCPMRRECGAGW